MFPTDERKNVERSAESGIQQTVFDRSAADRRRAAAREFLRSNPNRPPGNDAGPTETAEPSIDYQI